MSFRHVSVRSLISSISLVLATSALGGCFFESAHDSDVDEDVGAYGAEREPGTDDCPGIEDGAAYRDPCGACIERQADPDVLYYTAEPAVLAGECVRFSLPEGYTVEEIYAMTQNFPGAISSSWVYLWGPDGTEVASLNIHPEDLGVASGTTVLDPPVQAVEMSLCSWWNASNFIDVELRGSEDACTLSH